MFWANQCVIVGLGAIPLSLLKLPGLGLLVLRLRETGYDQARRTRSNRPAVCVTSVRRPQAGNLRLVMTKKKMAAKYAKEKAAAEGRRANNPALQRCEKWKRCRHGLVPPAAQDLQH